MLRRIGVLGLGIVMKGSDKIASRVHRVSKLARHPRTEVTSLVNRIMEAGELELTKVEAALRQRLEAHDKVDTPRTLSRGAVRHGPSSVIEDKVRVKPGQFVTFTNLKNGVRLTGKVKTVDLDTNHRFFLVQVVGDVDEAGDYYLCRESNGEFVGEDEI